MQEPETMIAERDARTEGPLAVKPARVRLAWRFRETGRSGHGPWMHRPDVVEEWVASLNRRHGGRIEHWIEAESWPG